ncbi:MAG: hypothetical protein FJ125_09070, partial [Deltaproteobacteria bacterium]|nr:hypothetical protein [Deltaproteobacteria bacterium]
ADNVEAIRRFRERGGHVGIATGRLPDKAQDLARALAADLPLIFANGALITDPHGALLRLLGFADAADLQRMCALVMASRCAVVYVAYASPKSGEVRVQLGSCSPSLQPGEQVVKLSARGCADHDHLFATLTGQLGRSYDVEEAGAGEQRGVSVGAAGVGKGAAIRWVAQRLGFALGQVAFVGDSGNDLSAAQVVHQGGGLCFAVANATEELKAVCPRRTVRDNGHGALAEAIRRLLGEQ